LDWYAAKKNELQPPPNGVPIIRLDKSRFALGEAVFFWVGVQANSRSPIPEKYQKTCQLTITRPDGTSKIQANGWPADGPADRGWLGGSGLGAEEAQLGRYTLVFEFAGLKTSPAFVFVEDVPLLKQIKAEFIFSRSTEGHIDPEGNVTLIVHNSSDQVLRFPQPNDINSMVSFSLTKTDGSFRGAYFYPTDGQPGEGATSFDTFKWDLVEKVPSVTLASGETFRKDLPLKKALGIGGDHPSVGPGRYDISFSTILQVLIGEREGIWSEISPVRIQVAATAGLLITR
jgi:hypothetical protein